MTIPVGQEYMSPVLGLGKIASYQNYKADTLAASSDINFGAAVQMVSDNPEQCKAYDGSGEFYGVAIAKHFVPSFEGDKVGKYSQFEAVSVLRQGIITVKVEEDVIKGEKAVIDKATANFRPSGTSTTEVSGVVGIFKTSASGGGLAQLEINLP
ncbi:hypothetical protein NST81_01900 [Bacillus sp. FSL W8-0223]|jgi:hypothetical protein|uniref:structural cement protein Gp24 n=1 Tax=Bacillus sp. FSL W8-0223 TaxID=2954595 RepID=UPI0030FC398F